MIFNVLLFKNANFQQINYIESALLHDKRERKFFILLGFRKATCVENKKLKLNVLS